MNTLHANDLQQQLRTLIRSLQLPDTALRPNAPPLLKQLDLQTARQLLQVSDAWSERGLFEETDRLLHEVILKAPETRAAFLASEVKLFSELQSSGEDQLHRGVYGLVELVLPIKVRGYQLHLLRSGKFREQPFSDTELKELAFTTGIQRTLVDAAAQTVPLRSGETLATYIAQQRRLRDALSAALEAQLQLALRGPRDDAAQHLAGLGALAEGAAHQFSNLLSIILGYSSLVLAKTDLPEEAATALNRISEAAQKGRRLTEEILTVSGALHEEESSCSLHECLNKVVALLQAETDRASAISLDLRAEHDFVFAAAGTLHTVLGNLLRHALDGAPDNVSLHVATRNSMDGGIEHIAVEVREGKGRLSADPTSRIAFPTVSEPLTHAEKKIRRRLAPSTIWVADDDSNVREMCRRVLTAEGHTVCEASSGESLQEMLRDASKAPDLLIYDFSMPDLDGVELVTWLRNQNTRLVPVILISGFSADHADLKRILQTRKVFLLQKPFSYRDMSDLVTIAMGETLVG
ncbi:MAG: response regulator [Kiritimatiellae bacterium]|nr:response regulator [Kiritimatiellia bacterium]